MNLVRCGDGRPNESRAQGSTFDGARLQNEKSGGHAPFFTSSNRACSSNQNGKS